jgi:hypothetical protein
MSVADRTPLWKTLTDDQEEQVKAGVYRFTVNQHGAFVAEHVVSKRTAVGLTPRRAIEALG